MRRRTTTTTAAVTAAAALGLAGCGGSNEPAAAPATVIVTAAPAATTAASAAAATSTATATRAPATSVPVETSAAASPSGSPTDALAVQLRRDGTEAATGTGAAEKLAYTVDLGFKVPTKQRETLELVLTTAKLTTAASVGGVYGQDVGARPGRLLLVAEVQQSGSGSATVPSERWRLRYEGGPAAGAPVLVRTETQLSDNALELAFDVPVDVERATLTATPGKQVQGTSTNDFGRAVASFPLTFPPSG